MERVFQMDESAKLMVMHNISDYKFWHAHEIGGLVAPSLAIVRHDMPLENFGEISLIGHPDRFANPRSAGVKVFNADVYSPRHPRPKHRVDTKILNKTLDDLSQYVYRETRQTTIADYVHRDSVEQEGLEAFEIADPVRIKYLAMHGIEFSPVYRQSKVENIDERLRPFVGRFAHELEQDELFIETLTQVKSEELERWKKDQRFNDEILAKLEERFVSEDGKKRLDRSWVQQYASKVSHFTDAQKMEINRMETRNALDSLISMDKEHFKEWVKNQYGSMITGRYFVDSNGRKKEYTAENLLSAMTRNIRDGEGFSYGVGNIRAKVARQFKSMQEIKDHASSLVSEQDMKAIKKDFDTRFYELAEKFAPYSASQGYAWHDTFADFMKDLADGKIREWQSQWFSRPAPDDLIGEAKEFLSVLRSAPSEYFEVKMQRIVELSEFACALVPENLSPKTKNALKDLCLDIIEYPHDNRQNAIQKVENEYMIQKKKYSVELIPVKP